MRDSEGTMPSEVDFFGDSDDDGGVNNATTAGTSQEQLEDGATTSGEVAERVKVGENGCELSYFIGGVQRINYYPF